MENSPLGIKQASVIVYWFNLFRAELGLKKDLSKKSFFLCDWRIVSKSYMQACTKRNAGLITFEIATLLFGYFTL